MAWSEAEVVCRRHPNEIPQPGICPSCLRERLSRIAGNSRIQNNNCSSSSPSISASPVYHCYYSSASSSGFSSPSNRHRRRLSHHRVASDIMDSIYFAISGNHGLKKSRSMANYGPRNGARDHGVNRKKKGGFWNKLLLRYSGKKAKF